MCYFKEGKNTRLVDATKEEKKLQRKATLKRILSNIRSKTISVCIFLLHFFAYDVGAEAASIRTLSLTIAICGPVFIAIISGFVLDHSNLGALLVLISVAYKFWLAEEEYRSYQQQFAGNGKNAKPPVNPHQTARGMFVFAAPLMFVYFVLQFIYPAEVSTTSVKLLKGSALLILSIRQDLNAGLACVFEAEYPKPNYNMENIRRTKYYGSDN